MPETVIAVPGAKRVVINIPAPDLTGRPPVMNCNYEGFEMPNEHMSRLAVVEVLIECVKALLAQEYMSAVPESLKVQMAGMRGAN